MAHKKEQPFSNQFFLSCVMSVIDVCQLKKDTEMDELPMSVVVMGVMDAMDGGICRGYL